MRPKSNVDFWSGKLRANRERDERKAAQLRALGWHVEVVWECQVGDRAVLNLLAQRLLAR